MSMNNFLELQTEREIKLNSGRPFLLVERWSKNSALAVRKFLLKAGVEVNYLLIIDKLVDIDALERQWSIGRDTKVNLYYLFLQPLKAEIRFIHDIGAGAIVNSHSLVLGNNQDDWRIKADYNFQDSGSFGRVKVEASLRGQSSLDYAASMNVSQAAQKSDTRVDMRLYLEENACGQVTPGLNIAAHDVKAGHSASTFRLAPEDLFYLQSRGLSLAGIKKMLSLSLAKNFIQGFPDEALSAEVLDLISTNL